MSGELERAASFLRDERLEDAASAIACLKAARPGDPAVLTLEGRLLRRRGRFLQAAARFARSSQDVAHTLHLAEALAQAGKTSLALSSLRRALAQDPRADALDAHVAALYAGDFARAVREGERVLDASRRYEDLRRLTWLNLVHDYRSDEQPPALLRSVLRKLAAYRRARPDCPWGRYWEFYFRDEAQKPCDPAAVSRDSRAAGPLYAWMRYQTGKARFLAGDFAGAEEDFAAAAGSCEPANWRALAFRAETLWCLGEPESAWRAAFESSEAVTPPGDLLGMRTWKGEVLLWAGHYEEALALIRESTALGPSDALVWEGAALTLLGRPAEGLRKLDAMLARSPRRGDALLWRAETLLRLGRHDDALAAAERAVRHYKDEADAPNAYALAVRALARQARGERKGAEKDWKALPGLLRAAGGLTELFARSRGLRSELRAPAVLR